MFANLKRNPHCIKYVRFKTDPRNSLNNPILFVICIVYVFVLFMQNNDSSIKNPKFRNHQKSTNIELSVVYVHI